MYSGLQIPLRQRTRSKCAPLSLASWVAPLPLPPHAARAQGQLYATNGQSVCNSHVPAACLFPVFVQAVPSAASFVQVAVCSGQMTDVTRVLVADWSTLPADTHDLNRCRNDPETLGKQLPRACDISLREVSLSDSNPTTGLLTVPSTPSTNATLYGTYNLPPDAVQQLANHVEAELPVRQLNACCTAVHVVAQVHNVMHAAHARIAVTATNMLLDALYSKAPAP